MLKQHCKDTITLYNYLGEVEHRATYTKTVIRNVYMEENRGVMIRVTGNDTACKIRIALYDDTIQADKPFLPYHQWAELQTEEKTKNWTLCPGGKDRVCIGICEREKPPEDSYKINAADRRNHGQRSLWHWEVTGA